MTAPKSVLAIVLLVMSVAADAADPPAQRSNAERLASGARVYEKWCAPCHDAGAGHAGTMALEVRLGKQNAVLLERSNLVDAFVRAIVRNGFQMMPPFRETEISDAELEAVAVFVASGGGRRPAVSEQ